MAGARVKCASSGEAEHVGGTQSPAGVSQRGCSPEEGESLWKSTEAHPGLHLAALHTWHLCELAQDTDSPFPAGASPCTAPAVLPAASEPAVGPAPPSPGAVRTLLSLWWGSGHSETHEAPGHRGQNSGMAVLRSITIVT